MLTFVYCGLRQRSCWHALPAHLVLPAHILGHSLCQRCDAALCRCCSYCHLQMVCHPQMTRPWNAHFPSPLQASDINNFVDSVMIVWLGVYPFQAGLSGQHADVLCSHTHHMSQV